MEFYSDLRKVEDAFTTLAMTSSYDFLLGGLERVVAVALQISLSVVVWFSAKNKEKRYLYPVAIFLHFAVDAFTVLLSGLGVSAAALEGILMVLTTLVALYARRVWVT